MKETIDGNKQDDGAVGNVHWKAAKETSLFFFEGSFVTMETAGSRDEEPT